MSDPKTPSSTTHHAQGPQQKTDAPFVGIENAIRAHTQKRDASDRGDRPYKHGIVVLTGISVIIAGVGAIIAGIATFLSANQTQVNRQALVAVQRAFVFPAEIIIQPVNILEQGRSIISFHPIWENSGATPTRNFRQFFHIDVIDPANVDRFTMQSVDASKQRVSVIAPHAKVPGGIDYLTPEEFFAVGKVNKPDAVLYGQLDYDDVFGAPHVTKFCYDYKATSQQGNAVSGVYVLCARHNCADDDCRAGD